MVTIAQRRALKSAFHQNVTTRLRLVTGFLSLELSPINPHIPDLSWTCRGVVSRRVVVMESDWLYATLAATYVLCQHDYQTLSSVFANITIDAL